MIYVNDCSLVSGFICWNPATLVILSMKEVRSGQSNGTGQKADFMGGRWGGLGVRLGWGEKAENCT